MKSSALCSDPPLAHRISSSRASVLDLPSHLHGRPCTRRVHFLSVVRRIGVAPSGSTGFQIKLARPRLLPHQAD